MLSNQLLTGQEVDGALVPDDAGNILQGAVNRLLKGVRLKQVQGIFAAQNTITASPLGSPTATSPEVRPEMTWDEWLVQNGHGNVRRNVRKVKVVPQSQIALPL